MAVAAAVGRFLLRRRVRLILRASALALILFGPIALAAWDLHFARPTPAEPFASAAAGDYRSRRSLDVDRLLPEGGGGTFFYETLNGNLGEAYVAAAAIGLSGDVRREPWPEAVELHERAHLLEGFLPEPVARLMARLPAPDASAVDEPYQHFATMAGRAWEIVAPPGQFCLDATPVDRLLESDRLVPGTAGFVAWYLRHLTRLPEDAQALGAFASQLIAPYRAEWDALWKAVEARRRPDGSFQPWPPRTVRQSIDRLRMEARLSGRWIDHLLDIALIPSLWVVRATDWLRDRSAS